MKKFLSTYTDKDEENVTSKITKSIPWTEKYRPKSINEISSQEEVVNMLRRCMTGSDFPNLLFYGPPGTGKTSTILAAAHELFGKENFRDRVLELNASDERGIAVVREKVKIFSKTAIGTEGVSKNVPHFKLVILDESDNMTKAAQAALRRTMEVESKSTRFCLICNYVTKIIPPIVSRCAKFRFKSLESESAVKRLSEIAEAEGLHKLSSSEKTLLHLLSISEGDLRRAITIMQSCSTAANINEVVDENLFTDVIGEIPESTVRQLMDIILNDDSHDKLDKKIEPILRRCLIGKGYGALQLLYQLHDIIVSSDLVNGDCGNSIKRSKMLKLIALCEERLMDGAGEYLQIMSLISSILKIKV